MVELARLRDGDISIRMFKDHAPPHFHAVKDSLTNKQEKRVLNWARGPRTGPTESVGRPTGGQ